MAYNASLANFMESQGVPYSGGITALAPVSNEQVTSFLQANPTMTDAQIASAMNQYGVSPAQMAAATGIGMPEVQSRYDAAQAANQNYQNLVTKAYGDILGRTPETEGLNYWKSQLASGAINPTNLYETITAAAQGADVANAQKYLQNLATSSVKNAYQDVLGREAEKEGLDYWTSQLLSKAIPISGIAQNLAYGSQGLDRIAAQKYLGKEVWAPEAYLKGTSGMGYQDIVDYINANIQDPVKIAQAAARYGIDPSEILAAKQAVGGQDIPTLQTLQDYLAQGKAGLGTRIQDIITSTIGGINTAPTVESLYKNTLGRNPTPAEIEPWKQKFGSEIDQSEIDEFVRIAQTEKLGAKYNKPLTTADLIRLTEGELKPSDVKLSSFTSESLANKSIEEIEDLIAQSPTNRLQEADRVSGLFQNLYGTSKKDATQLKSDLLAGKDTDDFAESIYKDLVTKGFTKDVQNKVLLNAAKTNPTSQYFKDNPDLFNIYKPLVEKTGTTGQYDYVKNAPLLNAVFGDEKLGDKNQVVLDLGNDTTFGWTTNSKYAGTLMRGPAIFGLEFNNRNDIEKAIAIEQGVKNGTIVHDYETNTYYNTRTGERAEVPKSDNERKGYVPDAANTLSKLQEAAQKAGLNPASYKSAGDLFDALEDKTKNIYQVLGRAIDWNPEVAKNLGITQTTSGRGGVNHANVLYERIGDKLVPINAKAFEFHDPNTSRGFFGDIAQGIASIPFIAEASMLIPGMQPFYPVIKGAQTMALGGDLGDAIKAGGLAYLTTNVIPKYVTPQVSLALAKNPLVSELALAGGDKFANFIIDGGTRAIVSSGLAAITGQDPDKAAITALVNSGIGTLTKEGLQLTNVPEQYRGIVSNIISSTILGQDPKKSLTGAATNILKNELKDFGKETVKSDQDKTTKDTKI